MSGPPPRWSRSPRCSIRGGRSRSRSRPRPSVPQAPSSRSRWSSTSPRTPSSPSRPTSAGSCRCSARHGGRLDRRLRTADGRTEIHLLSVRRPRRLRRLPRRPGPRRGRAAPRRPRRPAPAARGHRSGPEPYTATPAGGRVIATAHPLRASTGTRRPGRRAAVQQRQRLARRVQPGVHGHPGRPLLRRVGVDRAEHLTPVQHPRPAHHAAHGAPEARSGRRTPTRPRRSPAGTAAPAAGPARRGAARAARRSRCSSGRRLVEHVPAPRLRNAPNSPPNIASRM